MGLKSFFQHRQGAPTTRIQRVLTCPDCGGNSLYYENALITGFKYHCKDCDYIGALVIEQDVEMDAEGRIVREDAREPTSLEGQGEG